MTRHQKLVRTAWLIPVLAAVAGVVYAVARDDQGATPHGAMPPPPEVSVARVISREVRPANEFTGRVERGRDRGSAAACQRLHRARALPGRQRGPQGRPALRDRPAPLQGRPRRGERAARARAQRSATCGDRIRARLDAARRQGDIARGVRRAQRRARAGQLGRACGRSRGRVGATRPAVHRSACADRRPCRARAGDRRQPRAGRLDAAHDTGVDRPGPRVLRGRRADVPARWRTRESWPAAGRRERGPRRACARSRLPAPGQRRLRRQPGRSAHRHDPCARRGVECRPRLHARAVRAGADGRRRSASRRC